MLGTTHADLSPHPIPLTRPLTGDEIAAGYEAATGAVVIEAVRPYGPSEAPFFWQRQFS